MSKVGRYQIYYKCEICKMLTFSETVETPVKSCVSATCPDLKTEHM
jgi:hypothetical protein